MSRPHAPRPERTRVRSPRFRASAFLLAAATALCAAPVLVYADPPAGPRAGPTAAASPSVTPSAAPSSSPVRDAGAPVGASAGPAVPPAPSASSTPSAPDDSLEGRRARAAAAFSEGIEAYRRGQFAVAAGLFDEAYHLLPDPAPLFNMARSLEGANEVTRAVDAYERYLVEAPNATDRADVVERINSLRTRPAQVFITSEPPGAAIFVDEEGSAQPSRTPAVLRMPPGRHVVSLEREGHERVNRSFVAEPGDSTTIAVQLPAGTPGGNGGNGGNGQAPRPERPNNERRSASLGARFAFQLGAARAWSGQPLALSLAGEASLYAFRYFTARLRFERVEPDGAWTFGTGEAGASWALEDIDLGLTGFLGVGHGWMSPDGRMRGAAPETVPVAGVDARVDWQFHAWLSLGAYFRLGLRNMFVAPVEVLNSFGVSLSLTL